MNKLTCAACGGTHTQKAQRRLPDGTYSDWYDSPCLASGTIDEIVEGTKHLLVQFVKCKADKHDKPCAGCEYEREEIMNHLWHYGEAQVSERLTNAS